MNSGRTTPTDHTQSDLRAAPTTVNIGGYSLSLSTKVWRVFQRVSGPDGGPLIATVTVFVRDGGDVPGGVLVPHMWVLHGQEVWSSSLSDQPVPAAEGAGKIVRSARGGPRWETGSLVDVVVRLEEDSGTVFLLRAPGQVIQRVD